MEITRIDIYGYVWCNGKYMGDESYLTSVICGCINTVENKSPIQCKEVYIYDIDNSHGENVAQDIHSLFFGKWDKNGIPQDIIKMIFNNEWDKIVELHDN